MSDKKKAEKVPEYDVQPYLVKLIDNETFFCTIMMQLTKHVSDEIPTAGVGVDKDGEFHIVVNPTFMSKLTPKETSAVLMHELYHLVFFHCTDRKQDPPALWNIAADLAVNSTIATSKQTHAVLPKEALLPGIRPEWGAATPKEMRSKLFDKLASKIESFSKSEPSNAEFYFDELKAVVEDHCSGAGDGDSLLEAACAGLAPLDDHSGWDKLTDEQRDKARESLKAMVQQAVNRAESTSTGWGSVPAHAQSDIKALISRAVDWRAVLRAFVNGRQRAANKSTHKRLSRKQPLVFPGVTKSRGASVLVLVDESGSVDDGMLASFFGTLNDLAGRTTFWVLPFDYECTWDEAFKWRRGQKRPTLPRTRCGGTNFDAAIEVANKAPEQIDGIVILTDGECSQPRASRVRRLWIIPEDHKLLFSTDDLVVTMRGHKKLKK